MNAFICPKGHASAEPDYCSECGAKITGAVEAAAPAMPQAQNCPDCGAPREQSGAVFCDVCGYNFATGAHGELGGIAATPPPPAPVPPTAAVGPAVSSVLGWEITISVDPALRDAGSPPAPTDVPVFTMPLAALVSLIGRKSTTRAIFPEIPLTYDDAVSHRHALLQLGADGGLQVRDIGSSNGTRLNGKDVKPMADIPLKDGDEITLGHWSRILVKAVQA
jgi:ribosomal protein L37AE/L43A